MPPKTKFTKEQIIDAAVEIVRTENFENLTARALAKALGSSVCPIFTVFENMKEVECAARRSIRKKYGEYIEKGLAQEPAFKGVGTQYILFAINEPKFFQILFMSEQADRPSIDHVLPMIDENYDKILASITSRYGMSKKAAERLYRHLWIYTHGIASLCATKMCRFTAQEISQMMSEVFCGLIKDMKEEKSHDQNSKTK